MTYNSNHIEGSRLTHDQTRYIYETNTIGLSDSVVNVDDIIETVNHFRCIDLAIDSANQKLTEALIKQFHEMLKSGTADSRREWFAVGSYKRFPNEVGGHETIAPEDVAEKMRMLLGVYNAKSQHSFGLNPKFCVNSQRGENRSEFNVRGSGFIRLPLVCSITPAGMDVKGGGKAAVHRSAAQRRADP